MKKIPIEIHRTSSDRVTVIVPQNLDRLEILGLAEQIIAQLGVPEVKIILTSDPIVEKYGA
jgi:hypothetical protein